MDGQMDGKKDEMMSRLKERQSEGGKEGRRKGFLSSREIGQELARRPQSPWQTQRHQEDLWPCLCTMPES